MKFIIILNHILYPSDQQVVQKGASLPPDAAVIPVRGARRGHHQRGGLHQRRLASSGGELPAAP